MTDLESVAATCLDRRAEAAALRPMASVRTVTATLRRREYGEVLTLRDVAAYLNLPVSTVYRLVGRGELPGQKMGRQWRFHKPSLDDWLRGKPKPRGRST